MARFYKTASANPLDYMYRINVPLMEKVIAANDEYITQNLQQAQKLGDIAASFPYLQSDEGRAREIVQGYSKQVDEITDAIRSDPANWRKQLDPMRNLSRDLQQNYKVGEISKIAGNYGQYKKVADEIDKQVAEYNKSGKGISADRAKAYKEYFLRQFTAKDPKGTNYNPKTGEYNAIQVFDPMGNVDIRKILSDELDKMKADKKRYKVSSTTGEEWYFNDVTQEWEGITPERVLSIVTDRLSNPQLMEYLKQDSQVGLINGVFDDQGKFIAPYNYNGVPISPDEQKNIEKYKANIAKTKDRNQKAQLQANLQNYEQGLQQRRQLNWNDKSYLAPIMRGIVEQQSYEQTITEDLLRNNSKGSTKYVQAQTNARHAATLAQQKQLAEMREAGVQKRFDDNLGWQKYKHEHPQTKGGTGTGSKKEDKQLPIESSVSRLSTNSFEDWTTTTADGEKVKVLSNAGLSADINRLRDEEKQAQQVVNTLDKQMKDFLGNRSLTDLKPAETAVYNKLLVEKEAAQLRLPKIQSDLNARRKWYGASTDAALTNNENARRDADGDIAKPLSEEEVKLYKEYIQGRSTQLVGDYSKLNELEENVKGIKRIYGNHPSDDWAASQIDLLNKVKKTKEKVDERRNNFLAQVRYTPIDTDAINVGEKDSKSIAQLIFDNPQGLKIYDKTGNKADTGDPLDGKGINFLGFKNRGGKHKGDNYNMTFTGDNPDLIAYMQKHNVTPIIEQVGNTTKIGTGNAVVKMRFKDPNGEIPNEPFYIELTPQLQKLIASNIHSNSKDEEVKAIAGNMLDDEANDIRKQLITPTIQRKAGSSDNYDPVTFTIFINNGNQKIPLQVTKFAAEDGTDHLNITQSVNGVQVPLSNTPSGIPGWFNEADDFINYIKTERAKANQYLQNQR